MSQSTRTSQSSNKLQLTNNTQSKSSFQEQKASNFDNKENILPPDLQHFLENGVYTIKERDASENKGLAALADKDDIDADARTNSLTLLSALPQGLKICKTLRQKRKAARAFTVARDPEGFASERPEIEQCSSRKD